MYSIFFYFFLNAATFWLKDTPDDTTHTATAQATCISWSNLSIHNILLPATFFHFQTPSSSTIVING